MDKEKFIIENTEGKKILGRYMNGNHYTVLYEDGTKERKTGYFKDGEWVDTDEDHYTFDFPESFDLKITDRCTGADCPYCHENSSPVGIHGDLSRLDGIVDTLTAGTEVAVGGGNILEHPGLYGFLVKLKDKGVIANITVNQKHLLKYRTDIEKIVAGGLVHGIGVSLTDPSDRDSIEFADSLGPNVVYHVIAGIFDKKAADALANKKVLILGYKDIRRGHVALAHDDGTIKRNTEWLKNVLPFAVFMFSHVSFDDLAVRQLNPQEALGVPLEKWGTLYQGSDTDVKDSEGNITCSTMFVDLPNMLVARMSSCPVTMRRQFTGYETVSDLLRLSTVGWEIENRIL